MYRPSVQQQLVRLLAAALQMPSLPNTRKPMYLQMLRLLTEQEFPEGEPETAAAMEQLLAELRTELGLV